MSYLFFWGEKQKGNTVGKECLSQWYPCTFKENGYEYDNAEQYMMASKALLFQDMSTFKKIMATKHDPREVKHLGRIVKNFKNDVWDEKKFEIVEHGNFLKFSQNEELKNYLLSTKNKHLVEASPYDKVWGIGLGDWDKRVYDESKWKGENLLGIALMNVRVELSK